MDNLNSGNFHSSVSYLQRANQILNDRSFPGRDLKLKAMTLNNLGCLYKRMDKYSKALEYLNEALELERQLSNDPMSTAATHLNICAIRSNLGHHEAALAHAQRALSILTYDTCLLYTSPSPRDS